MDDFNLVGEAAIVASDVERINAAFRDTGLRINPSKCEISTKNFKCINGISTFSDFRRVEVAGLVMLGAPVMKDKAVDSILQTKIDDLERAIKRLALLPAHDGLTLLRNCLAMPRLLYVLRTAPCSGNPLLEKFDTMLRDGLSSILNVHLTDDQWVQASLPVHDGGLGLRSARMLAPSAFLASAAATLKLQNEIIPSHVQQLSDQARSEALEIWSRSAAASPPVQPADRIQKVWDAAITAEVYKSLIIRAASDIDRARLLSAAAPHSGDWLLAPPISAIGLRLSNEMIRVAVGFRLGANTCEPHQCICGCQVDARGLHGLSCRKSTPRHQRHSNMNDIIWRAMKRAQIPAVKEPVGLSRDGKRPDGDTLIPWSRGKPLAWDATVPDTFAQAHVSATANRQCAAADTAATSKITKYEHLAATHHFVPVAVETGGSWNQLAIEFIQDLGKRTSVVTKDDMETQYLFQRLAMAVQRGNVIAFINTFSAD